MHFCFSNRYILCIPCMGYIRPIHLFLSNRKRLL
nr:MAG TPA: hypothetical protein [Caudoviricetes sp.]